MFFREIKTIKINELKGLIEQRFGFNRNPDHKFSLFIKRTFHRGVKAGRTKFIELYPFLEDKAGANEFESSLLLVERLAEKHQLMAMRIHVFSGVDSPVL